MEVEQSSSILPNVIYRIRSNWLNKTLHPNAIFIAAIASGLIAFVSLAHWDNLFGISKYLEVTGNLVFKDGEYWRLWTSALVHSDFKHLLSNLFLFFILGWFLFGYFGSALFPLSAFLMGGVINALILPSYDPFIKLVGASGIVFYLGGLWLGLYFLIQRQHSLFQRFLRVGGVTLALFMPSEAFDPSISYRTHFLGLAVGFIVAGIYFSVFKEKFRSAEVTETILEEPELDLQDVQHNHQTSD